MHKIESYEDACRILGIEAHLPDVSTFPEKNQKSVMAFHKLTVISEAINEGWKPDWTNWDEYKFVPWFQDSGSGLAYHDYDLWLSRAAVGSRLCYQTREAAEYVGKKFEDLYRDFLTL